MLLSLNGHAGSLSNPQEQKITKTENIVIAITNSTVVVMLGTSFTFLSYQVP